MSELESDDETLLLEDELILDTEQGGENAIEQEAGVLLLSKEVPADPVVRKIEVAPRVSRDGPALEVVASAVGGKTGIAHGWTIPQRPGPADPPVTIRPVTNAPRPLPKAPLAQPSSMPALKELARLLIEARSLAAQYDTMRARTRTALYQALGRTYDLALRADQSPDEFSRLVEEAGLTAQDRATYSPAVKLAFGAGYDKTRISEYAAAIAYGRHQNLPAGSFAEYLEGFDGGLKAVVALARMLRKGHEADASPARTDARPAIARKLRRIAPRDWSDLPPQGDEFSLLLARRMPDGSVAMVGEVPRDIALLEKAARKLIAELRHPGT